MRIDEFSTSLYDEMKKRLAEIESKEDDNLQISSASLGVILQFITRLKEFTHNYKFGSQSEEINFFKDIKPKFLSKLIYHQKIFSIQTQLPVGTLEDVKNYYLKEIRKIRVWFHKNIEFLIYYRSYASSLDEIYFVRKEPDSWLLLNFEEYETDLSFTTVYDHKVSKIIAFRLLSEFLKISIDHLEVRHNFPAKQDTAKEVQVIWTDSKVALIELLYALQSLGSCNNGQTDLKQLATLLEYSFNIDLGNYYRVFQEMRIRKINRTSFLDRLKDRLIQRMDEADENPKFK